MIVDAATHVWSDDAGRYPWAPLDGVDVPEKGAPPERLLADLDAAGVDAAVVVQPRAYGYDHAFLAAAIARYPDRIAGVCLVDPDDADAPERLADLVAQGFRGLRLVALDERASGLAGAAVRSILARAAGLGIPVGLLVDPPRLAEAGGLAAEFPGLALIVDHLGLCVAGTPPALVADLLALAGLPNVHLRLSAMAVLSTEGYPFPDLMPLIRAVYRAFGGQRLLWGTDYPHALAAGPYRRSLDAVSQAMHFIAVADLPAILGGTAARLYHLN